MIDRYIPGEALFTSDDSDAGISEARAYIAEHGYSKEQIKLVKRDGVVQVITKQEILWPKPKQKS